MAITVSHKPTETGSRVGVMAKGDSQTAREAACQVRWSVCSVGPLECRLLAGTGAECGGGAHSVATACASAFLLTVEIDTCMCVCF